MARNHTIARITRTVTLLGIVPLAFASATSLAGSVTMAGSAGDIDWPSKGVIVAAAGIDGDIDWPVAPAAADGDIDWPRHV